MSATTRAHLLMLIKYPTFTLTNSEPRHNEQDAAWFYEKTFALNPHIDIISHLKDIAREWRKKAKGLYPDSREAKAMSSELLTPRLRRIFVDLHLTCALFVHWERLQQRSLYKILSIPRRTSISMVYGLPPQVVKLPCYLDYLSRDIIYEWLVKAVREHNPLFEMNQARGDQIFTHIYRSEFRGTSKKPAAYHNDLLKTKLKKGEAYWAKNPPKATAASAEISTYIMLLPNRLSSYTSFAQACVALNSACQPCKELVYEAFRLTFPLPVDPEGTPATALQKAIPPNLAHYEHGVSQSRDLLRRDHAAEYAHDPLERCINRKHVFPISQNFHQMILSDRGRCLIPLARLPLNNYPGIDFSRLYKVQPMTIKLDFWYMFEALNPWVVSESQTSKDSICDETWEIASNSNWANMVKMKEVVAPVSDADKSPEIAREDAADNTADKATIDRAEDPTDDTAAIAADKTTDKAAADNAAADIAATDNVADSAADSGITLTIASELDNYQAKGTKARDNQAGPVQQAAVVETSEEVKPVILSPIQTVSPATSSKINLIVSVVGNGEDGEGEGSCRKEHSADVRGSPTEVVDDCNGDADGVCHDWHSKIRPGDVERTSDQGHSAKAKGWMTEAVAESIQGIEKACDEGQSRKRKNRMADVDVEGEDEEVNASDEVLPLTKKPKTEDDGGARNATAIGGKSPA